MARNEEGLQGRRREIPQLRDEFWQNVSVPGREEQPEPGRSTTPAASPTTWSSPRCWPSTRSSARESCGGHFREEFQTPDGEALRKDEEYSYVAAWEFQGVGAPAGAAQGTAGVRRSASLSAELQVDRAQS